MEKVIHAEGAKNVDQYLDQYNEMKRLYEETGNMEYKQKMELSISLMKTITTPLTIRVSEDIPFHNF